MPESFFHATVFWGLQINHNLFSYEKQWLIIRTHELFIW